MLKANELRIGNFVYDIDKDIHREILEINRSHVFFKGGGCGLFETMTPIPLTKEWLFKFNWVLNPISNEYHGNNMILYNRNKYVSYGVTKLYYVHQLQNLYFALTGVELELSSNVA